MWKLIGLGILLIGMFVLSRLLPLKEWIQDFTKWIQDQGAIGIVVFGLAYIIGTIAFVPGSLLTIAAGIAFGLWWGTAVTAVSATLGASLAFLIGRHLARRTIEKKAETNEKFRRVDSAIGQQGWKIVLLLRLSPVIPFNLSNYVFGVTKIGFWPYVLASFAGMLPGTFLYVYLGHIGKATFAPAKGERSAPEYWLLGIGLAATIILTLYLSRLAAKALQERQRDGRC